MEFLSLKRDLPAIDNGRWVASDELPSLKDIRAKVRGHSCQIVRDAYAAKQRALAGDDLKDGKPTNEALTRIAREVLADVGLVDIEGLTDGDKPVKLDDVRAALYDPAFAPLAELLSAASFIVDASRVAKADATRGNS